VGSVPSVGGGGQRAPVPALQAGRRVPMLPKPAAPEAWRDAGERHGHGPSLREPDPWDEGDSPILEVNHPACQEQAEAGRTCVSTELSTQASRPTGPPEPWSTEVTVAPVGYLGQGNSPVPQLPLPQDQEARRGLPKRGLGPRIHRGPHPWVQTTGSLHQPAGTHWVSPPTGNPHPPVGTHKPAVPTTKLAGTTGSTGPQALVHRGKRGTGGLPLPR